MRAPQKAGLPSSEIDIMELGGRIGLRVSILRSVLRQHRPKKREKEGPRHRGIAVSKVFKVNAYVSHPARASQLVSYLPLRLT